jgi:glutamate---cysteine ligase / carboxylate-amine ligase
VEEEFVLLDPSTGAAVLAGPDLVRMLGGEPGVQQELMRFQVETGTGVCTGLDEADRELVRLRGLAAAAAASLGCRLVASGIAPFGAPGLAAVTGQPRYRELARRYGPLVADSGTCGCHVHVGVPSRELGVQVLARLRPWLAPLLAITVNSPIADGRDTTWASWRYPVWSRWPTATAPTVWPDAAAYDAAVRRLIADGAALDERSVYFLARLSPRYPTVEVRVADVCLDAGTAVLAAGLTRALVATALAEARRGTPVPAVPARQVAAALAAAARHGLAGAGQQSTRSPGRPSMRPRSAPGCWIMSAPRSATTATPRRSPGCWTGSRTGGPGPTASGPCSPAPHPRPRSSRNSPARRCPATSRAAPRSQDSIRRADPVVLLRSQESCPGCAHENARSQGFGRRCAP